MRCTATTAAGKPCQKPAMAGHEVCQPHSGGQVGRRSRLTDELQREILDAVRAGSYLAPAARRAGVSDKTVYEWLRRGREPGAPPRLAQFAVAYERAEAEGEIHLVAITRRQVAAGDGRLALELLARKHPDRWAKIRTVVCEEPAHPEEEPPLDLTRLSDEEYETFKELQRRASGR